MVLCRAIGRLSPRGKARAVTVSFLSVNLIVALAAAFLLFGVVPAGAQEAADEAAETEQQEAIPSGVAIGAGLATGLAAIGAGIAVAITGSAAIGGITQKPELLGRTLIFVGLAEGIAIYGLIISFMILTGATGG